MDAKNKGRTPKDAAQKTPDNQNYSKINPLVGWFQLAEHSKKLQQRRRNWKRGAAR
jgi:dTDP-4-amino-4,6-dideoxygalactose transaminase